MAQYIDKAAVVADIERIKNTEYNKNFISDDVACCALDMVIDIIDTLEVKDPYEQCVQYDSIKDGIQAHAETYSFNIESELFNQLTKEQQALWRKEIEQACISGGDAGYLLAKDPRYRENLKVKEVDLEKEIKLYKMRNPIIGHREGSLNNYMSNVAKYFFELGLKIKKGE